MSGEYLSGVLDTLKRFQGIDDKAVAIRANLDPATFSRYKNDRRPIPERHANSILIAIGEAVEAQKVKAPRLAPRG
jgi:hypothetical protein